MNLLDRIAYDPGMMTAELAPIPWPEALEPGTAVTWHTRNAVPDADVLVITWTVAEARALADVLTPGIESAGWAAYDTGWASYVPQLTDRSPARESKRLASWCLTHIGSQRVLCVKSELHPATDGPTIPAAQLACQLAGECGARLVITTGTAGGAGEGTVLGDVNVATVTDADFTSRLESSPLAGKGWATTPPTPAQFAQLGSLQALFAPNAARLPAQWAPRPPQVWQGATVSTDYFAYDTETDRFGLRKLEPSIRAVEMDDAPLIAALHGRGLDAMSVRNASDPVMPGINADQDKKTAEDIYQRFGYWSTVNSAIVCWALIASLGQ